MGRKVKGAENQCLISPGRRVSTESESLSSQKYIELLQLCCSWPSAALMALSASQPFKLKTNEPSKDKAEFISFFFFFLNLWLYEKADEIPFPCNPAEFHAARAENIPTISKLARKVGQKTSPMFQQLEAI